ncbi:hypothetical protein EJD04_23285 [Salmonella enterica]|nr:hypothetical protein [Salmonella enterica]
MKLFYLNLLWMIFEVICSFLMAFRILTSDQIKTGGIKRFSSGSGEMTPLHQTDKCAFFL